MRLSGQDSLAVRASKKLKNDELLITSFSATRLRMELDRVPLWRGNHVAIKQLVEDIARYIYLPRLKDSSVLLDAISEGLALLTWVQDAFGFADSFDENESRYRGLRVGRIVSLETDTPGLIVKAEVAQKQLDAERAQPPAGDPPTGTAEGGGGIEVPEPGTITPEHPVPTSTQPKRFHGTVTLDTTRVGRDASRIADEVIAHLSGLVGAKVTVTLEVEAEIPSGAPDHVVRVVTENSRTLKFTSQGFEKE
jgi:hypothetical protein